MNEKMCHCKMEELIFANSMCKAISSTFGNCFSEMQPLRIMVGCNSEFCRGKRICLHESDLALHSGLGEWNKYMSWKTVLEIRDVFIQLGVCTRGLAQIHHVWLISVCYCLKIIKVCDRNYG